MLFFIANQGGAQFIIQGDSIGGNGLIVQEFGGTNNGANLIITSPSP